MVCGGWRDFDSVSIRRLRGFTASRRTEPLRWRCDCSPTSRSGKRGAAPRWQDHEQRFEEHAPVARSVLGRGHTCLAVGVALVVEQLSRETRRLLRGDASVSRGCLATEDCRQPIADARTTPTARQRASRCQWFDARQRGTKRFQSTATRARVGLSAEAEVVRSNRLTQRELAHASRPRASSGCFGIRYGLCSSATTPVLLQTTIRLSASMPHIAPPRRQVDSKAAN